MKNNKITNSIIYVGVNDKETDLFENQYKIPNGISYNSYIILDEKIAIMDTVDERKTKEWLTHIEELLKNRKPDYLIISHMEPDHSANIQLLVEKYPNIKVIATQQAHKMITQFFDINLGERAIIAKEGDCISLGKHELQFIMAPMVHWPEVMFTYDKLDKILFSADAFGKFGTLDMEEEWTCEARRYYFNIVGKYGANVQAVLKKLQNIDINIICPLHGPILKDNLNFYLNKYDIWSSYKAEDDGVFIAYASIHGNTEKVAKKMAEILKDKGVKKVVLADLARYDMSKAIEDAFRYDKLIVACSTYNMGIFTWMEHFLNNLKAKNYQNRKVGIIENGSWAPMSGKLMKEFLSNLKNISICDKTVTIKSAMKEENVNELQELAEEILK